MKTQEIVKNDLAISPFVIFQTPFAQIREAVTSNLGEKMSVVDLQRIKMPSGGGTAWTVPDIAGEQIVKELSGIVLSWRELRVFWQRPLEQSGGIVPPDCYAPDARTGIGSPGGACDNCRFRQFGSAPNGQGQACKLIRQLLLLREGNLLPDVVNVPPASIKAIKLYFQRLATRGLPCHTLVTKIGLEKAKNSQGIEFSRATFTAGDFLPSEQAKLAAEYALLVKALIETVSPMSVATASQVGEGEVI
jgi:hypothetical protein